LVLVFIVAKRNYNMKITTRLSFQFTLIVFGILLLFSVMVYYFSYTSQLTKFRNNLLSRAQNTAILLIDIVEVDSTLLKKIDQTTKTLEKEEIALTNSSGKLLYSNNMNYLKKESLSGLSNQPNPFYFSVADKDGVVYKHLVNNQTFNVYALAFDKYRHENLRSLLSILLWSILFGVWLSVISSLFFSKFAIRPISNIIAKVKDINSLKLDSRLDEGHRKDEIEQLAITFNQMLSDLELVFKSQDEFVSNSSHELRTPLAIMIAETDYILSKDRKPQEYSEHLSKLLKDLHKLNVLLNSLLELAHLNRNNIISKSLIRADELVFNSIESIKVKYPGRKIIPKIEYSENESDLLIKGNSGLLEIALKNLIDNACKFSTDDIEIKISVSARFLIVNISDHGIGIPSNETDNIFKPFRRATNSKFIGGFGIGLSIVAKIIELHKAEIQISSIENKGTMITLQFIKHSRH
jgi:signal transduction histidine kinase